MAEPEILDVTKPIKLLYTKEINNLWFADLEILKNAYIQEEGYVEFDEKLFIVKKIEDIKLDGGLTSRIKMYHIMAELNDFMVVPFEYTGVSPATAMTNVLAGTTWSVGTVDIGGTGDVKSDKRISVLKAINLIAKEFDGEIDYICNKSNGTFTRIVDLKSQIGNVTKLPIRYDKNTDYIRREKDTIGLVTRLYLYGKGDITVESVNPTGKAYIDSTNINDYVNIKEHVLYTSITDKDDLLSYGQAYLALRDTSLLRYRINTMDLSIVPKWADEFIDLGDTLRAYDLDLGLNVDVRVQKLVKDLTDYRRQKIELANKFKTIVEPISAVEQAIQNITFDDDYRALDVRDITGTPRSWALYIGASPLEVGDYQGPIVKIDGEGRAYEIWCYCAWKPTISDVIIRMNRNGVSLGDVTIPFGAYVAPGEGEVGAGASLVIGEVPVHYGDLLNLDILAADGVASRVTAILRCH